MEEVPLKSIKCGKLFKRSNCFLALQEDSSTRLDFLCKDDDDYLKLRCQNITAIDLRVEAKFGSIEAMIGTLMVECLVLEEKRSVLEMNDTSIPSQETFNSTAKNALVQASFHVNETGAIRDLIRKLRSAYSNPNLEENVDDAQQNIPQTNPKHFKEGLPNWVQFIPYYLYSKRARQWIQRTIYIYMVFSVTWALWQLYRHVDFVRESVRPLIDILQYQYQLLDYAIRFFNTLFEEYTVQWLCFIKPLYTVISAIATPLLQTFRQLSPIFQILTQSVANGCSFLLPIVKPFLSIMYQLMYSIFAIFQALKTILARFWGLFFDMSLPTVIGAYIRAFKHTLWTLSQGLGQAQLDPFKAQLAIVRTTVIHSTKAVGSGVVRLVRKIYKVIWLRRSARLEKQE